MFSETFSLRLPLCLRTNYVSQCKADSVVDFQFKIAYSAVRADVSRAIKRRISPMVTPEFLNKCTKIPPWEGALSLKLRGLSF